MKHAFVRVHNALINLDAFLCIRPRHEHGGLTVEAIYREGEGMDDTEIMAGDAAQHFAADIKQFTGQDLNRMAGKPDAVPAWATPQPTMTPEEVESAADARHAETLRMADEAAERAVHGVDPRITPGATVRVISNRRNIRIEDQDEWREARRGDEFAVHRVEPWDGRVYVYAESSGGFAIADLEFVSPPPVIHERIADRPETIRAYEPPAKAEPAIDPRIVPGATVRCNDLARHDLRGNTYAVAGVGPHYVEIRCSPGCTSFQGHECFEFIAPPQPPDRMAGSPFAAANSTPPDVAAAMDFLDDADDDDRISFADMAAKAMKRDEMGDDRAENRWGYPVGIGGGK